MQATDQKPQSFALLNTKAAPPDARTAAAKALAAMNANDKQSQLASLLQDKDLSYYRTTILYALAFLHDKDHQQDLIDLIKNSSDRETAFLALTHIAPLDPSTLPALTEGYYFNHES